MFVCEDCGYIHDGDEAPDICPVCGALKESFTKQPEDTRSLLNE